MDTGGAHVAGRPGRPGVGGAIRDAISARAVLLIIGVLALQLGFVLSYIGAFHAPRPHHVPVAVVAPAPLVDQLVEELDGLGDEALDARTAGSEEQARAMVLDRTVDAAIVVDTGGTTDTLLIASAGGPSVAEIATQIARTVETARQRQVTVEDLRPPAPGDGRGLSSFYLALGWMIGGYLAASILGIASARPANATRTLIRLGALAVYAVVSGLGGALIVGPVLDALPGHHLQLWAIGTLLVFASAATTVALEILFGLVGIGIAILVFVILGNPSSGGAYASPLLPPFWHTIGPWLPPGAGTTAIRNTVYFGGHAIAGPLWILAAYAVGGTVVGLVATVVRRTPADAPPARLAV